MLHEGLMLSPCSHLASENTTPRITKWKNRQNNRNMERTCILDVFDTLNWLPWTVSILCLNVTPDIHFPYCWTYFYFCLLTFVFKSTQWQLSLALMYFSEVQKHVRKFVNKAWYMIWGNRSPGLGSKSNLLPVSG